MDTAGTASQWMMQLLRGYRASQLLITFAELGIGDALAAGPRTPAEITAATSADPAAGERFLQAAVGLGLLEQQGIGTPTRR